MKKEISLEGKRILVTGGATGLGYGIAAECRDSGAEVIIGGRREELLRKAASELGVSWFPLDVADDKGIPAAAAEMQKRFGPFDGLVNNAGIQNNKEALDYTVEEFRPIFETNVFGAFALTKEIAAGMLERRRGSIVFISSAAAHMGVTKNLPYTGSKGAVSAMCRALASEFSPKGVRVNAIAPGWIETDLVKISLERVPERRALVERRSMLGRLGTPGDIGMCAVFLLSEASAYITAMEIKVDGGTMVSL
ncbi:MAG: SDR family oxidoreductase [Treponema sp.]|jgi:gluconate 5-dehydrogenase|nr:SDR family oxidoreductase [Treponema sp.]